MPPAVAHRCAPITGVPILVPPCWNPHVTKSCNRSLDFALEPVLATSSVSLDKNWPQWQGPDRNGLSNETGLLKEWPEGGPKRVWMFENCGAGFGGPAIVDGRMYIIGARRDGEDFVLCLDARRGTEIWKASMGETLKNDWSDGSRGTPTVADGNVYALSGTGTLVCVRASDGTKSGRKRWRSWAAKLRIGAIAESVLVDGDHVLCTPGGKQGAIAALDKTPARSCGRRKT